MAGQIGHGQQPRTRRKACIRVSRPAAARRAGAGARPVKASADPSPRTSTPAWTPPAGDLDAQRDELLGLVVAQQRMRRVAPLGVRERARLQLERVDGVGERVEPLLADRRPRGCIVSVYPFATAARLVHGPARGQAASVATISSVAPSCSTSRRSEIAANRRWAATLSDSIVAVNRRTSRRRAASAIDSPSRRPRPWPWKRVADHDRGLGGLRVAARRGSSARRRRSPRGPA